ncbi:hypothetical protein [Phenylobacterium sp.]|jgi:hypothetical protein|uniref:hypothetical protein n=1 Tax=Phenylobacterium sp. TaxID=1871053 RepID=UPI002F95F3D4
MSEPRRLSTYAAPVVVLAGWAVVLALNLPGHLSVDSVLQLYEGRFHVRQTWGPAIYAWMLGAFDAVSPGTKAYLVFSTALLFGAWLWLTRIAGRAHWIAAVVAAALILTPNILIYQGIVWRDVMFANCAVLGFTALAAAAERWADGRRAWLAIALSVLALSVGALVRQNGPILWPLGAIAVASAAPVRTLRGRVGWGGGWLAAVVAVTAVLSVTALPTGPGLDKANARGMRLLQIYDLAGAVHREPAYPLPALERTSPTGVAIMREHADQYWSAQRIDFLNNIPNVKNSFNAMPSDAVQAEWLRLVLHRPDLYLAIRGDVLRWVVTTPEIDACVPIHVGIDGPQPFAQKLGLAVGQTPDQQRLYNYSTYYLDGPVMRHVTWAVLAAICAVVLLIRRRRADLPMAGLQLGALAFAASFFPLSLACDYRYLYLVDLAAMTGLFYLALDPKRLIQVSATSRRGRAASTKR